MTATLEQASWADVEALRNEVMSTGASSSVENTAAQFTKNLVDRFESVVLARLFLVLPFSKLDAAATSGLQQKFGSDPRLKPTTPVLTLLGTTGREPQWNQRLTSEGHLAIPLLDRAFVQGIPMIAKLLADLEADLANLDSGMPIASRKLLGGQNATFYVPDARTMVDSQGRSVISATPFVTRYGVRGVFGMGGAYLDGSLAVAVIFTNEVLERLTVDKFPSLIGNFKMATSKLVSAGKIFSAK